MRASFLAAAVLFCAGPAAAAVGIPDCAGRSGTARGAVTRVERNGALVLEGGRAVILESILLPRANGDGAVRHLASRALAVLSRLVGRGPVTFTTTPPEKDRYGRLRAQGFSSVWLQGTLLERGLARVMIAPDRSECAPGLYEAETAARKAGRGLWALDAFRIRAADAALKKDIGTFQIVEGRVMNVGKGDGRTYLDFSEDWRHGFSAVIAGEDRKTFRRAGFDLAKLRGRRIRLRGMVEDFGGRPEIALSNPAQIEMLD